MRHSALCGGLPIRPRLYCAVLAVNFLDLQSEVQLLMGAGRPLDDAELLINDAPDLTDDERAALWLFAWSMVPPQDQRHLALRYLETAEG